MIVEEKLKITNFKTRYVKKPDIFDSNIDKFKNYTSSYKSEKFNNIKNSYSDSFSIESYDLKALQQNFEQFHLKIEE